MESDQKSNRGQSYVSSSAIALSLAGGIIIVLSGSLIPWLFFANYYHHTPYMNGGMMMRGWFNPGFMGTASFLPFFWPIPLVSGIMIISGAVTISKRPQEANIWGIIVLGFSILALVGMGLSILGAILGIIGGIIALSNNKR